MLAKFIIKPKSQTSEHAVRSDPACKHTLHALGCHAPVTWELRYHLFNIVVTSKTVKSVLNRKKKNL